MAQTVHTKGTYIMADNTNGTGVLSWGDYTIELGKLPHTTQHALMQSGFTHKLGNEVASAVATYRKGPTEKPEGWVEPNDAMIATFAHDKRNAMLAAMVAGTLGVRASGPRLDPVLAEVEAIVRREITGRLKTVKLKLPKGDEVVTFAGGVTRTYAQMHDKLLADEGERIHREATRAVAEAKRKADAIEAKAAKIAEAGGGPEALGL